MKLENVEITFGSTVLVEKTPKEPYLCVVNSLCRDVPGSFLHCHINGTGWVTIIRYSKLKTNLSQDYCLLRIVVFKKQKHKDNIIFDEYALRNFLYDYSSKHQTYCNSVNNTKFIDTTPIICNKELLTSIITQVMHCLESSIKIKSNLPHILKISLELQNSLYFTYSDRSTECSSLYGERIKSDGNRFMSFHTPEITQSSFAVLESRVNDWKQKFNRKERRLLKKSLTLNPI